MTTATPEPEVPRTVPDPGEQGRSLLLELSSRSAPLRLQQIQKDPKFHRWALAETLLEEAGSSIFDDVEGALALTELAVAVSEALPVDRHGPSLTCDLRARCWARYGNAQRVHGDPLSAEQAFGKAHSFLRRGTGKPLLAARVAELEASLLKDQQRFPEAHRRLDEAIEVYRQSRTRSSLGRALVVKGSFLLFEDRPESALRALREAVPLLRPEKDVRTFVLCAYNIINALNRTGYSIAAHALVADIRRLFERLGDSINLLRLDWLVAEINLELGRHRQAEEGLRQVRQGFLERGMAYDAALLSLDLAALYLESGDPFRMQGLVEEMLPIFQARSLHQGMITALILFRESVALRQADAALVREVATYLRQARRDRTLRFRPS
ncbi:MAG: hypothetical protein AAF604_24055 [Acidobacteriota bacterium]